MHASMSGIMLTRKHTGPKMNFNSISLLLNYIWTALAKIKFRVTSLLIMEASRLTGVCMLVRSCRLFVKEMTKKM